MYHITTLLFTTDIERSGRPMPSVADPEISREKKKVGDKMANNFSHLELFYNISL
jgi:hypothetical protein